MSLEVFLHAKHHDMLLCRMKTLSNFHWMLSKYIVIKWRPPPFFTQTAGYCSLAAEGLRVCNTESRTCVDSYEGTCHLLSQFGSLTCFNGARWHRWHLAATCSGIVFYFYANPSDVDILIRDQRLFITSLIGWDPHWQARQPANYLLVLCVRMCALLVLADPS